MLDKYEWRRITAEIRRVLMDVWDPIGVKGFPEAQDEYDCCLGPLFRLLTTGATDDQIADYLWRQANDHMGLTREKQDMYPTVTALRRIAIPGTSN